MSTLASVAARPPAAWGAGVARAMPWLVEFALVVAAIAWLWPLFARVAQLDPGRDQRFLDRGIAVSGLPPPVLPAMCDSVGAFAEAQVATALCGSAAGRRTTRLPSALPADLAQAIARATEAFVRPLRAADERARALSSEANEGAGALREHGDAVAGIEADLAPYLERFQLTDGESAGPLPRCAARWVEGERSRRALRADHPRRQRRSSVARATPCSCSPPRSTAAW